MHKVLEAKVEIIYKFTHTHVCYALVLNR